MKKKEYNADDITPLSLSEAIRWRLKDVDIDLMYVIIGYLLEHFGGYNKDEKVVDLFFVNEKEKAQFFASLCRTYLTKNSLPDDVVYTESATGHSQVFSKSISTILDKFYTVRIPDFLHHNAYSLREDDPLFQPPVGNLIYNYRQFAFLIGATLRGETAEQDKIILQVAQNQTGL